MAGKNSRRRLPSPLKRAIFESGLTQAELAVEVGIGEATVSRIVNGLHTSDDTKAAIARVLGRQVQELFPEPGEQAA